MSCRVVSCRVIISRKTGSLSFCFLGNRNIPRYFGKKAEVYGFKGTGIFTVISRKSGFPVFEETGRKKRKFHVVKKTGIFSVFFQEKSDSFRFLRKRKYSPFFQGIFPVILGKRKFPFFKKTGIFPVFRKKAEISVFWENVNIPRFFAKKRKFPFFKKTWIFPVFSWKSGSFRFLRKHEYSPFFLEYAEIYVFLKKREYSPFFREKAEVSVFKKTWIFPVFSRKSGSFRF